MPHLPDFQNHTVTLLGAGISNMPLAQFLIERGATVTVRDRKSPEELEDRAQTLRSLGVTLITGEEYLQNITESYIFRSPGIRPDIPELVEAVARGAHLTSEMECFLTACPCPVYAVTGSDGKSTTTTITHLFLSQTHKSFLGGNIGEPLLHRLPQMHTEDRVAVELSSFQLMTIDAPVAAAAITNVTPNHLNWHTDMAEYIEAKKRILRHAGRAVLNYGNAVTKQIGEEIQRDNGIPVVFFAREPISQSALRPIDGAIYIENGAIVTEFAGDEKRYLMTLDEIRLPGLHNAENYMTAIALTWGQCPVEAIVETAKTFGGVEHRLEFVAQKNGVTYINGSIDSSPTRTAAALSAIPERSIVLICGGYDKHIPFAPLAEAVLAHPGVHDLVLTGATAEMIMRAMTDDPQYAVRVENGFHMTVVPDFDDAFRMAASRAKPGDTVLLSPACASFDAFPNFEVRGRHFKELVHAL